MKGHRPEHSTLSLCSNELPVRLLPVTGPLSRFYFFVFLHSRINSKTAVEGFHIILFRLGSVENEEKEKLSEFLQHYVGFSFFELYPGKRSTLELKMVKLSKNYNFDLQTRHFGSLTRR